MVIMVIVSVVDGGEEREGHYLINRALAREGYIDQVSSADGHTRSFTPWTLCTMKPNSETTFLRVSCYRGLGGAVRTSINRDSFWSDHPVSGFMKWSWTGVIGGSLCPGNGSFSL